MTDKQHYVIISLASNSGQEHALATARRRLAELLGKAAFTRAIWTAPVGSSCEGQYLNQQCDAQYLNQLCEGVTSLSCETLNGLLKQIETDAGRTRNGDGIVALDLDVLQYDDRREHLRDWGRSYVKDLLSDLKGTF